MFKSDPSRSFVPSLSRFRVSRLALVLALIALPGIFLSGCYGDFALTKAVYQFNGDCHPSGVVESLVMWVFGFIFVYSVAVVLDVAVFNLIEFWTDDNPMTTAKHFEGPNGSEVALTPLEDGQTVRVDLLQGGSLVESRTVKRTDQGKFEIQDQKGERVGSVQKLDNGDLELSRTDTSETRVLPREVLDEFRSNPAFAATL